MNVQRRKTKNLGHRGASGHAPENTVSAFRIAERVGADGFEFDVQVTSDGVPVVIHDEYLNRTTNGSGLVNRHTYAELSALDAGSWYAPEFAGEKIPTLEEVIREFGGRMYLNIELKNSCLDMPDLEEKTIELVRRYQIEDSVVISSFDHESMVRLHALAPDLPFGLLYDCRIVDVIPYAERLQADALHPFFATVRPEMVRAAHAAGLAVNVWTVNEIDHMKMIIECGVDAIITNYPDRLRSLLD